MDKELKMFLKLNIQRFAEDKADNEIEEDEVIDDQNNTDPKQVDGTEIANGEETEQQEEQEEVDKTKAFSNRLKQKTEELENKYILQAENTVKEKLDLVAKEQGYNTWEEYNDTLNKNLMIEAGVDDPEKIEKVIKKMIDQNPEVLKAKKIIEQAEKETYNKSISEQVDLINKIDSNIKTLDDISKLDNCNEITEKVKQGYKLYDAYVICNLDKIQNSKIELGKKRAISDISSKDHIKTSGGKQSLNVEVPKDIYDMYKKNTKMTDEQIREHYKKNMEE